MIACIMFGNGSVNNKRTTTDFTIDCILSKSDQKENGKSNSSNSSGGSSHQQQPLLALNKVLHNPWIPLKNPLALAFNPSSHLRRLNFHSQIPGSFYDYSPLSAAAPILPTSNDFIQNLVKTTHHHTSIHNHFYANGSPPPPPPSHPRNPIINSNHFSDAKLSLPKFNVYDGNKKFCDTQLLSEEIEVVASKTNPSPSLSSSSTTSEYKCSICFKYFDTSELLDVHVKSHAKPKFSCSQCDKQFSQLRNFKYHMSIHAGTKEFAASCPECGKTFNDKGYLSSHLKIHRNKKEHVCPYCPKSFNQRVAFNMHVRIHLGLKPHSCTECGKTFSRKMLLKQHYRTHSGEKPYKCSFEGCEKRFADRSNMILHFRLHSGIKPFACNLCPKRFSKKHHLGTHLNYHLNLKPYSCLNEGCEQKFTQSSNMRTHMKKCPHRKIEN